MSDAEMAASVTLRSMAEIAERAGIPQDALIPYGRHAAKIDVARLGELDAADKPEASVVLLTAISPTPAGEGKTTVTIGLADGLRRTGSNAMVALREPSMGPVFGMKGGATGGGRAQVAPMDAINLHFTGDFHAITSAHNLLCALIDNHLHHGNELDLDPRTITLRRALDVNDRSLRQVVNGLGGRASGVPRETGFEITVATETMAAFCLAADLEDLTERLGRIIIGRTHDGEERTVADLGEQGAQGAMAVVLKDAVLPNLVQTLEATPAVVHGGPFANIAHGANSIIALNTARRLADVVVTEAGFGADLGAEKFMQITGPTAGAMPNAVVVVATVRALKFNGGMGLATLNDPGTAGLEEHLAALEAGVVNLGRHVENMQRFGAPVVVAINRFTQDDDAELAWLQDWCRDQGVACAVTEVWAHGGAGAEELAGHVRAALEQGRTAEGLFTPETGARERIERIVTEIYGGAGVEYSALAARQLADLEAAGEDRVPVCMAKTPYSFSDDPARMGAPEGFTVSIRELRRRPGAGFLVALTGQILTMPGLPRRPAADGMSVVDGQISGLS
ncbi:formate--tetrahydrofolate ligase [Citricoccus sp. NR2]|uniref:formate--tetrahydrofolate ligase n=1 Tax=Citricoccus sp. NR2 TaxID=3004095 RepID=UPI0022DCFEAB|nr:formate--tetrahydrofolate ligase [Citricoccus sp. NR2]WBL19919.1 formate--tetrahydrofolate ligase [Citricoccus sp. NR2]